MRIRLPAWTAGLRRGESPRLTRNGTGSDTLRKDILVPIVVTLFVGIVSPLLAAVIGPVLQSKRIDQEFRIRKQAGAAVRWDLVVRAKSPRALSTLTLTFLPSPGTLLPAAPHVEGYPLSDPPTVSKNLPVVGLPSIRVLNFRSPQSIHCYGIATGSNPQLIVRPQSDDPEFRGSGVSPLEYLLVGSLLVNVGLASWIVGLRRKKR